MKEEWKEIFSIKVDNRKVRGLQYNKEDYKVITTQKEDYDGKILDTDNGVAFVQPSSAGREIHAEGSTLKDLETELILCDFTKNEAEKICKKFQ